MLLDLDESAVIDRCVSIQPVRIRWHIWGVTTFIWLLALVLAAQQLLNSRLMAQPTEVWEIPIVTAIYFLLWGAFAPLILRLVDKWPVARGAVVPRILLHSMYALGFFLAQFAVWYLVLPIMFPGRPHIALLIFRGFYSSFLFYWCIVGVGHAIRYYRELEAERLKRAEAQAELVKAQLDVLKIQLNPHFLFNTLHSIAELMHQNIEAADRTITRLAEMLRMTLSSSHAQMVSFDQELKVVDLYVGIQKTRFGDRVRFVQEVDERSHRAVVPSLILQPLIENAFVHGVGRNLKPSQIVLRAEAKSGHLHIEVVDDCDSKVPKDLVLGVGLGNVVNRIRQIYQDKASVDYGGLPGGGFRVSIRLPLESEVNVTNGSNKSNGSRDGSH